jgi:hypothetical protein
MRKRHLLHIDEQEEEITTKGRNSKGIGYIWQVGNTLLYTHSRFPPQPMNGVQVDWRNLAASSVALLILLLLTSKI